MGVPEILYRVSWEFPSGLTGRALCHYGLPELQTALEDAGATVTVSAHPAPVAGPQTAAHGRDGATGGDGMDASDRDAMTRLAQRAFGRRAD